MLRLCWWLMVIPLICHHFVPTDFQWCKCLTVSPSIIVLYVVYCISKSNKFIFIFYVKVVVLEDNLYKCYYKYVEVLAAANVGSI